MRAHLYSHLAPLLCATITPPSKICAPLKKGLIGTYITTCKPLKLWNSYSKLIATTSSTITGNDRKAKEIMEESATLKNKAYPPNLPNNRIQAQQRLQLLKKRLLKDSSLCKKYKEFFNKTTQARSPTK